MREVASTPYLGAIYFQSHHRSAYRRAHGIVRLFVDLGTFPPDDSVDRCGSTTGVCHRAEIALPCKPDSVGRARHWVLDQLSAMYGLPDSAAHDAEVVVSELVTNSVQARCRQVLVAVEGHHTRLTVAATDDASGSPVLRAPAIDAVRGRGLLLVEGLAQRWGVDAHRGRKTVWAEIAVPWSARPSFDCADTTT